MIDELKRAEEISGAGLSSLPDSVVNAGRPMVLRGAVADWPIVQAARESDEAATAYVLQFYTGRPVGAITAAPSERGQFFYRPDSKQMNFGRSTESLTAALRAILEQRDVEQPYGIAMQAIPAPDVLPGFQEQNPNPLVPAGVGARLWIGNRAAVAPHFDVTDNIACVAAGRRRFVIFPPEQTANLYPGPLDVTPASVPISMVPLDDPNLDRFPRYREALAAAFVAELDPGDAVYIPYLWWHGVQSLAPFNILVNYWWNRDPGSSGPNVPLLHLVYQLFRQMPREHRKAWQALYGHYVFQENGDPMAPLEPQHRESERTIPPEGVAALRQLVRELLGV